MLKIIEVSETRTAKDGRDYFVIRARAGFGQKAVARTMWEQFKRDSKTGEQTEEKYWERGSREEALKLLSSGETIDATKVTRTVEAYVVGENTVTTYSTIVFADENIETVFQSQNHPIVDEATGEVKIKAVVAPPSTPAPEEEEEETTPAPKTSRTASTVRPKARS